MDEEVEVDPGTGTSSYFSICKLERITSCMQYSATMQHQQWGVTGPFTNVPQISCVTFTKRCVLANINIPGNSHDAGACQKSVDMVQYRCTIWVGGMGRTSWTSLSPPETIKRSSRITNRYTQNAITTTVKFKVCKSVHHCTIQINNRPDATIFQFIILTYIYSSTSFGRFPAHHQKLNNCSGSLWFYLRIVVTVGQWLSPWYKGKTRGCHCSHWAPDDGRGNARNMLSCK